MTHEEAALLLPDHAEGRLTGPTREDVAAHASSCPDCQAFLESYQVLAEGFRSEHPSVEELVDLALGRGTSVGASRAALATHLDTCASCAGEVEAVRRVQAEAGRRRPLLAIPGGWQSEAPLRSALPAALAAGIALLILAYPAFLGVSELPRVRDESKALRAREQAAEGRIRELSQSLESSEKERRRVAAWSGTISVPLIAAPVRSGDAEPVTVTVARGQPFVCLAADPGLPDQKARLGNYGVEIVKPDGGTVWSIDLEPSEVGRQLRQTGSLAFLIPAEMLPSGKYRLRIIPGGSPAGRPALDVPFVVEHGD